MNHFVDESKVTDDSNHRIYNREAITLIRLFKVGKPVHMESLVQQPYVRTHGS